MRGRGGIGLTPALPASWVPQFATVQRKRNPVMATTWTTLWRALERFGNNPRRFQKPRRRSTQLLVERLEDRLAPANLSAVQSGNWSDAATWGGAVPTSSDDVTIGHNLIVQTDSATDVAHSVHLGTGGGPTVRGSGTLIMHAGDVLTVTAGFQIGANGNKGPGILDMTAGGTLITQTFTVGGGNGVKTLKAGAGTIELTGTNTLPAKQLTTYNNLIIDSG